MATNARRRNTHSLIIFQSLTEGWRLMETSRRLGTVSEAKRLSPSGTLQEAADSPGEIIPTLCYLNCEEMNKITIVS